MVLGFLAIHGALLKPLEGATSNIGVDILQFLEDTTTLHQPLGLLVSLATIYFDDTVLSLHPLAHELIQACLKKDELIAWGMMALCVIYQAWVAGMFLNTGSFQ
ncbi:hypothetical protein LZ30DRAFT_698599 [Colletotrichum cereale]|nr:hypothetical protein LZ30DRAFT_698599 [Colletotrichum cereale]